MEYQFGSVGVSVFDIRSLTNDDVNLVANILPDRFERSKKFLHIEDRDRCLVAGLLLVRKLGITDESQILIGPHGKPYVPGLPYFNISHSGTYVALATAEEPVGVDIEKIDAKHIHLAHRVYNSEEIAWMEHDPLNRFYVLWTQKESVMKLTGQGLSLEPSSFSVAPWDEPEHITLADQDIELKSWSLDGYVLSVAKPL